MITSAATIEAVIYLSIALCTSPLFLCVRLFVFFLLLNGSPPRTRVSPFPLPDSRFSLSFLVCVCLLSFFFSAFCKSELLSSPLNSSSLSLFFFFLILCCYVYACNFGCVCVCVEKRKKEPMRKAKRGKLRFRRRAAAVFVVSTAALFTFSRSINLRCACASVSRTVSFLHFFFFYFVPAGVLNVC